MARPVVLGVTVVMSATLAGAVFVWRGTAAKSESETEIRELQSASADFVRKVKVTGLDRVTTLEQSVVDAAESAAAALDGTNVDTSGLARAFVAFLSHRFPPPGSPRNAAHSYVTWRETSASLRDLEELSKTWFVAEAYEAYFGEPLPGDATAASLFPRLVEASDEYRGGRFRPVGIAVTGDSISVAIGKYSLGNPAWPVAGGPAAHALSGSGRVSSNHTWWSHDEDLQNQLNDRGSALTALIVTIMEFESGIRRPVGLAFVYGPSTKEWILQRVLIGCGSNEDSVRWEF